MQRAASEWSQDSAARNEVPPQALFHSHSYASIHSGATLEWSASISDAALSLKSSSIAQGFGRSCPIDSEAFLLEHHIARLEGLLDGKYRVEDGTARHRLRGQGMIAYASTGGDRGGPDHRDVVIKTYFCSRTFERERSLLGAPELKHVAAACIEVIDFRDAYHVEHSDQEEDRTLPIAASSVVPMLVVSEKGLCLSEYMQDNTLGICGTPLQVISGVAELLLTMHDAGYVHRDIKPGNIVWLSSSGAWSLIDFGCAANNGCQMPVNFTLWYAAPETMLAFKGMNKTFTADSSVDLFAFGIVCYELLTGKRYYQPAVTTSEAGAMLAGHTPLPHELMSEEDEVNNLGGLHGAVLRLLDRDPQKRGTMHDLLRATAAADSQR